MTVVRKNPEDGCKGIFMKVGRELKMENAGYSLISCRQKISHRGICGNGIGT